VYVLFGSPKTGTSLGGLSAAGHQRWFLGTAQFGDRLGAALAGGDFNGDTVTDLAIGIPGRDVANLSGSVTQNAGAVLVLFGRDGVGLTDDGHKFFVEFDFTLSVGPDDHLGSVLAAGDFDGDRRDDLAMGAPDKNVRALTDAGAVFVQYSDTGPLTGREQVWEQNAIFGSDIGNLTGSPTEAFDRFGWALAAGDFNADGRKDLAIGVPFETVLVYRGNNVFANLVNAGEVDVIYGSATGLSITGRAPQQLHQDTINIEDTAEAGDQFGYSLTAWNFGKNETRQVCSITLPPNCFDVAVPTADLAIGVPFEDVGGIIDAGAVNVIYGQASSPANGLTTGVTDAFFADQFWTQSSIGQGASEERDYFGAAMY
jgi:hypothetical protein